MAEQIPYSVAASLTNRLASLAFREFGRIYGVMDELERLKDTIESIKAVLLDAEEQQEQDHAVKIWIRRLKQVLHAADDLLDDFAIEDLRHKVDDRKKIVTEVRHFFSPSNPIVFRGKMAHKINKIRKNFNDVAEDMSKLNLRARNVVIKENESAWRETSCFVVESDIIGREDSRREIINLLKQPHQNQNVSLIAIVGLGGLGKTAVAQLVYNDVEVQNFFEKRMWVCVSDNFDVKIIMKKILESLVGSKVDNLDQLSFNNLQNELREKLSGKRYLLVLDDMWNESHEKWIQLRTYLRCGAQDSKVLVTTRSKIVAQTMSVSSPYILKGLNTEESWSLLKKLVFGEGDKRMNHTLESIGKEIAKKCRGVPLAIRTVAGILLYKDKESEWINVLEGDFWKLCEDENTIMPVLKLSYQNLSPQLRQCFAYCSIYPKDWEFGNDELIQLWMAQGYIECSSEKQNMEDVGNQFIKILLMKSFFQDALLGEDGNIICFKMHDLMHDLATLVAGNDCYLGSERKELVERPMQMSLESNAIGLLDSMDGSRLRTLFLRMGTEPRYQLRKELSVISSFKCLRALDLSESALNKLPGSIGKLRHLRYLDLSLCRELASLPESISNLVCLQTLKLNWCVKLEFSTKVVTKLISLRHLEIVRCKAFEDMVPAGLGKLTSLQHLSTFVVGNDRKKKAGKLNELKDLNNLRGDLEIYRLRRVRDVTLESQEVNLKDKKLLWLLGLHWGDGFYGETLESLDHVDNSESLLENLRPHQDLERLTVTQYPGVRFSNWLSSLTNISLINLVCSYTCRYLPPLARLPSLKSLRISHFKLLQYLYDEEVSPTAGTFFPSLERLEIEDCGNLMGWQRMRDDGVSDAECPHHLSLPSFPRLSTLQIMGCPKLTCMPTFPHLVEGLELISCSVKPLTDTLNIAASSSSSFAPLSMLKSLRFGGELELVDIKALPNQWMRNLTSLEHLFIHRLKSQALEEFKFWFMDNLDCLPSLQKITLNYCRELKALPDWICNLPSLQHIQIRSCPDLASYPEGMPLLTNLLELEIIACPHLLERDQLERDGEWRKIAHIPRILLKESD